MRFIFWKTEIPCSVASSDVEALFEQVGVGGSGNAAEVALHFLNLEFSK